MTVSESQWRYNRNAEQARILSDVVRDLTEEEADRLIPPRPPKPASQHDTYLAKEDRSERNLRYLLIAMLIQRDGNGCYLCHHTLEPSTTVIEHIIPLCYGGDNEPWNVALACLSCNARKANNYVSLTVTSGSPVYHVHRTIREAD